MNKVNLSITVTDEMIDGWLSGAFEGGSNYWCSGIEVKDGDYKGTKYASDCVSKGGIVIVDGKHEITKQKMLDALVWLTNNNYTRVADDLLHPGRHDACDSDIIFQVACFGEVVYG